MIRAVDRGGVKGVTPSSSQEVGKFTPQSAKMKRKKGREKGKEGKGRKRRKRRKKEIEREKEKDKERKKREEKIVHNLTFGCLTLL